MYLYANLRFHIYFQNSIYQLTEKNNAFHVMSNTAMTEFIRETEPFYQDDLQSPFTILKRHLSPFNELL